MATAGICDSGIGSSPRTRGTARRGPVRPAHRRFIPAHAGNSSRRMDLSCLCPVHPRARGEQSTTPPCLCLLSGSSPRTRGTVNLHQTRAGSLRFIPAHAGNSARPPPAGCANAVHPRARGEQNPFTVKFNSGAGSSPRTRGTAGDAVDDATKQRFIPAHAGNRPALTGSEKQIAVHPRARGEQPSVSITSSSSTGSSPRTRGTETVQYQRRRQGRFIPAHAGNSARASSMCWAISVHPRARGEQAIKRRWSHSPCGSSPRTRGTGVRSRHTACSSRFIPAHAGNRSKHTCTVNPLPGSSPRTRGTGHRAPARKTAGRFIPAHAGNRETVAMSVNSAVVHPRARGEQAQRGGVHALAVGSSPRTRGTGRGCAGQVRRSRFIPAHAGNRKSDLYRPTPGAVHPRARGEQSTALR